nr:hypothetical protein [uncultured Desulfuromonas sp.]
MKKLFSFFIWTLCFVVLLFVADQFLLRYPDTSVPVLHEFQEFYRGFRSRLLNTPTETTAVAPVVLDQGVSATESTGNPDESSPKFIYVDQDGQLNFAASLDDVPQRFRSSAQPLEGR